MFDLVVALTWAASGGPLEPETDAWVPAPISNVRCDFD
jgi:hypothetical protein